MDKVPNSRIAGAVIVGFALVAGAYVLNDFGEPNSSYQAAQTASNQVAAPIRAAIEIVDGDGNGIEDWQDELVTAKPVVVPEVPAEIYTKPETLTGQVSLNFFEQYLQNASLGINNDESLITNTVANMQQRTSIEIYDVPDIVISNDANRENIRRYANAVATAILLYSQSDLENELFILQDIINRNDTTRMNELEQIAEKYRRTRDAVLLIPVPAIMVKEHLDLVNTLHAVHHDIESMLLTFDDPAYSLLRIKRYQDDVLGMQLALENFHNALVPYSAAFKPDDPVGFFTQFNPTNPLRI